MAAVSLKRFIRDDCQQRGLRVPVICSSGIACQVYDTGVASTVHSFYVLGAALLTIVLNCVNHSWFSCSSLTGAEEVVPTLGKLKNFSLLKSKIFAHLVKTWKPRSFWRLISCSHTNQWQGNVQKNVLQLDLLFVFHSSRCLRRLTLHDFIFSMNKL